MSFVEDNLLRDFGRSLSRFALALHEMLNPLFGQPSIFWSEPPRDDSEDGHTSHDDRCVCNR